VQSLTASSRSVQTVTQADAVDATCGFDADGTGAGAGRPPGLAGTMAHGAFVGQQAHGRKARG